MAKVTAFTAERTKAIEDNAIVDARIEQLGTSVNVFLVRHNGSEIPLGDLRGPAGPTGPSGSLVGFQPGFITPYAGRTPPSSQWLLCDGSSHLIESYLNLFNVINFDYGADGSTRFRVPDLRARIPIGRLASDTDFATVGGLHGSKTRQLSVSNLPKHTHGTGDGTANRFVISNRTTYGTRRPGDSFNPSSSDPWVPAVQGMDTIKGANTTGETGSGTAFNNMPPVLVMNYLIKV